jgi:hypothetical protein
MLVGFLQELGEDTDVGYFLFILGVAVRALHGYNGQNPEKHLPCKPFKITSVSAIYEKENK